MSSPEPKKRKIGFKGDHRHINDREEPYRFTGIEKLLTAFAADIDAMMAGVEESP